MLRTKPWTSTTLPFPNLVGISRRSGACGHAGGTWRLRIAMKTSSRTCPSQSSRSALQVLAIKIMYANIFWPFVFDRLLSWTRQKITRISKCIFRLTKRVKSFFRHASHKSELFAFFFLSRYLRSTAIYCRVSHRSVHPLWAQNVRNQRTANFYGPAKTFHDFANPVHPFTSFVWMMRRFSGACLPSWAFNCCLSYVASFTSS